MHGSASSGDSAFAAQVQERKVPSSQIRAALSGFGPFHNIAVNPSWQCLAPLHGTTVKSAKGRIVNLSCTEVQVAYSAVEAYCEECHRPASALSLGSDFAINIHVGVSPTRDFVSLEKRSRRYGYERPDVTQKYAASLHGAPQGRFLQGFVSKIWDVDNGAGQLETTLDVEQIARDVGEVAGMGARTSNDAGLFLCEYIYYCSLAHALREAHETGNPVKPTLFIHVPMPKDAAGLADISQMVCRIVCAIADSM